MPVNYNMLFQGGSNPFGNLAGGVMAGMQAAEQQKEREQRMGFADEKMQAWRAQQEAAKIQAAQAAKQQAEMQAALDEAAKDPSVRNIRSLSVKYPQFAKQFEGITKDLKDDQKNKLFRDSVYAYNSIKAGKIDEVVDMYKGMSKSYYESGDTENGKFYEDAAKFVKTSPESSQIFLGGLISTVDSEGRFFDTEEKMGTMGSKINLEKAKVAEKKQTVKNLQIEEKKLKQELESKRGQLRPDVLKDRNAALSSLKQSRINYKKASDLIAGTPVGQGGVFTQKKQELLAWLGGGTKEVEGWKQKLAAYKLVDILKNKPPGALSEKELDLLKQGAPSEGADDEVIADYLLTSQKAIVFDYAYDRLKALYLSENNDQGAARRDITLGKNLTINQGETFDEFIIRKKDDVYKYGPEGYRLYGKTKKLPEGVDSGNVIKYDPKSGWAQ